MGLMVHGVVAANRLMGVPTVSATVIAVPANSVAIYLGDNVPLHMQVQLYNAWWRLVGGIRDRALMDASFRGAIIYSQYPYNRISENTRTTSSQFTLLTADSIGVGVSAESNVLFSAASVPFDSACHVLIDTALQGTFKAA